jgi:hypothetical protein
MKVKPYVGITGPVTVQETKDICREFSQAGYSMGGSHIPMLGFLVSYKTLNNKPTNNRRYPLINTLPDLLKATEGQVLTMIHYNSKEIDSLSNQITEIFSDIYENGLCKALQLNIAWPDIYQVEKIKKNYPKMQIVFQASHKVMDTKTPKQIVNGIKDYKDLISYVLIDPSGGRGTSLDVKLANEIYLELNEKCPNLRVGFAGNFNGENVASRTKDIIQNIGRNDFCIDSESGLRDKISSAYGDDLLNIQKVSDYLKGSSHFLN